MQILQKQKKTLKSIIYIYNAAKSFSSNKFIPYMLFFLIVQFLFDVAS